MYQHAKNRFIYSICSFFRRVPSPDWPHPFLTKLISKILICVKLYQHAKNQLVPSFLSWDTVNFRVQIPDWPHSFLTMPQQKLFNQFLVFMNLYQQAKNEAVSSICSGKTLDLKIPQSNWLRAFWPISQEQHFSQIEDLYKNTANNTNFHYRANTGKINGQFFKKIQKTLLLAHFSNFWGQKMFFQKIWHAYLDKVV